MVNGGEPQNPLIPTNTNDSNGGRIVDRLFAGLMSYDANGTPTLEVAQSIDTTDNINYRVVLKPGWTFSDGSPVTARSFVDAWNYGALATNAQLQQSFFSPIAGFDELAAPKPVATAMSGLRVLNDREFTVQLKVPTIDFKLRLGFSPFYPLPPVAFRDMTAFGQHPIGNGPYKLADGESWQHNVKIDLVPNPAYHGSRAPQNNGLRFVFYANLDTAYADLLSANLDVLDTIPTSVLPVYRKDLGGRTVTAPAAVNQTLDTPLRLAHFGAKKAGCVGWPCRRRSTGTRSVDRSSSNPARPPVISRPVHCPDTTRTSKAATRWTSTRSGPAGCGRGPTASRNGAGAMRSLTTRTAVTRSGWTRWPTASRTPWVSTRWRATTHVRGVSHPDHRSQNHDRVSRRLAGRLPVDAGVSGTPVRHRGRRQRRRLLQPGFRRRAGQRRGRAQLATVLCAGQPSSTNPVARHASCAAVVHH
ncbi:bacterial extracellular solute-binding s, 5 Middle family protein [Mycobacterium xenopi 3993]|nr:bacterial extracellular solute-binding s, 5 Middle family protein [Mycobacterium xenopi 3993]